MTRCLLTLAIALLLAARAAAFQENSIPWSLKVEQSIAQAQQTRRPLMFWVLARSARRGHDIEREQKRAFRDPLVLELSSRFVAVQLSRSRYRDLLEKWDLPPKTNLEIVFATPDGEKIDTLSPLGVAKPEVLARKMALVFQHYRQQMFARQVKPTLEDEQASDQDLRSALKLLTDFLIVSGDQSVIDLLDRGSLAEGVRNEAYVTLAALSTPASVKILLEHAIEDQRAAAVLSRCTPDAAEQMLAALGGEDPALHLLVYRAVTGICKIRDVKPGRFWQGRYEQVKQKEIERVRRLVTSTAQRWRERYAEYR